MKKTIGTILLAILSLSGVFLFVGCTSYEQYYGTYTSGERTIELVLSEDKAHFGTLDTKSEYFVKYSKDKIGISKDSFKCYWGDFDYEFIIESNDASKLVFKGYLPDAAETVVDIVLIKVIQ